MLFNLRTLLIINPLLWVMPLCAQLTVSGGGNPSVCKGSTATIGGSPTASGGTAPYTYSWVPATYLNSTTVANPVCTPLTNTNYTVFVRDAANNTGSSTVSVFMQSQSLADAGPDQSLCEGDTIILGGPTNYTGGGAVYSWAPSTGLSSNSVPYPQAWPMQTTTYTLTVTGPCPTNVSTCTVTVHPLPTVNAGPDVTIYSGQSTSLNGSGAATYYWTPNVSIIHQDIPNPDVDPTYTITYVLTGVDQYGCAAYDAVTVTVLESDSLFFYNTFTPNADGDNDFFYIGNIYQYPENTLTVYSRYGRIVYNAHPYVNQWHGKSGGEELPAATYYYILDPGNGQKPIHGAVTIIR